MSLRVEQYLLGAVSLVFVPMIVYCATNGYAALGEAGRFGAATVYTPGAPEGGFYRVEGVAASGLLSLPEYPEAQGSLQIRVTRQIKSDPLAQDWVDDERTPVQYLKTDEIDLQGVRVRLTGSVRIASTIAEAVHETSPTVRQRLHFRPAAGTALVAIGTWKDGVLTDGKEDRLLIAERDQLPQALETLANAGRMKGLVLCTVAAVMAVLSGLSLNAARKSRGSDGRPG